MRNKKAWIGILISAVFLYLAFRNSNFGEMWHEIRRADWTYAALSLPLLGLSMFFRAVRWRYLLMPYRPVGVHSLFGATMIGFMSLNVLPLRLGEFIRAYVLGRRENLPVSGVFSTIVVERIFDGFSVLLLLVLSLLLMPVDLSPEIETWIRAFTWLALVIYFVAIVFVVLVKWRIDWITALIRFLLGRFPKLEERIEGIIRAFAGGLDVLRSGRLLAIIMLTSLVVWLTAAGFYGLMLFGFSAADGGNLGVTAGIGGALFVIAAVALGIMIPASPGFVGTYEMAAITALTFLGASRSVAESYAVISHALNYFPITITGIIYLYVQNFSLGEISAGGQLARETVEDEPAGDREAG